MSILEHSAVGPVLIQGMMKRTWWLRHHCPGFVIADCRVRFLLTIVKLAIERCYLSVDVDLSL